MRARPGVSEQDNRSALVALTERQILWLKKILAELARKTGELGYKRWDGMPLQDIDKIVEQMRVAAYALQQESEAGRE